MNSHMIEELTFVKYIYLSCTKFGKKKKKKKKMYAFESILEKEKKYTEWNPDTIIQDCKHAVP